MRKKVKITKVSYYPWKQGGLRFHFAHTQLDTETGNYVGSYAPGLNSSLRVLEEHGYSLIEVKALFDRAREAGNWEPIMLPKPLDATMIL